MKNRHQILEEVIKLKKQAENLIYKNITVIDCKFFNEKRNQLIEKLTSELSDEKTVKLANEIPEISTRNLSIKIIDISGFLPTIFRQINRRNKKSREIKEILDKIENLESELKS